MHKSWDYVDPRFTWLDSWNPESLTFKGAVTIEQSNNLLIPRRGHKKGGNVVGDVHLFRKEGVIQYTQEGERLSI